MSLCVLQPGLLTTVQDLGRWGYQRDGVPVGGAMDSFALRAANLLVGNGDGEAALEITLDGPELLVQQDALLALAGADLGATIATVKVPPWRPFRARAGATLRFGGARAGCRAYLAVAGGIATPEVLGSRSTSVGVGMGGVQGRALREGDLLPCGEPSALARGVARSLPGEGEDVAVARWGVGPSLRPLYGARPVVRLLPGAHARSLTPAARRALHGAELRVSPRSDRIGYRLQGPRLELSTPVEPLSEAVAFGTVQLPPDGAPIVLMADRPTTGGYPRIGEVATVDLPLLAQLRPGDHLRFVPCTLAEAQALLLRRERDLSRVRRTVSLLYG